MKVEVLLDEDDVVIYARCQDDNCGLDVRSVTVSPLDGAVMAGCGHVQTAPERLVWVVRDAELDCGV